MQIYHQLNVLKITWAFSFIIQINILFTGCIAYSLLQITNIPIGYAIAPTNRLVFFRALPRTLCQIMKNIIQLNQQKVQKYLLQLWQLLLTPVGIFFPASRVPCIRYTFLGVFRFCKPLTRYAYTNRIFAGLIF